MSREGQSRRGDPLSRRSIRLVCLAVFALAPAAWAQENGIKLGDGRVHPYFDVEADYDSAAGFFQQGTGAAAVATLSPEILFHFRPGLRLELPASFVNLNLGGDVDWVQYSGFLTGSSTAASHLEAAANVEADFNKSGAVEFDIGDNFSRLDRTQNVLVGVGILSLYDQGHIAVPIHPGGGALTVTPSFSGAVEQLSALSSQPVPGCAALDASCQPGLVSEFDYWQLGGGLAASWRFLPKTALVLDSTFDLRSYNNGTGTSGATVTELLHAQAGLVGLVTAKIAVTLKAGWGEDFAGHGRTVIGHAEANYLVSDTASVRAGYLRDLQPVPAFGTYSDDRGYAEARFLLGGRLTLRAYGGFDWLTYLGPGQRNDELVTIDAGPSYQFARWLIGTLGYTLNYRVSGGASGSAAQSVNYARHVGYLRLTFTY